MLKSLIPFFLILLNAHCISAQEYSTTQSTFKHLVSINSEWLQYKDFAPSAANSFKTDQERIAFHLKLVSEALGDAETNELSYDQQQKRADLLDTLESYALRGVFPINLYHQERIPYFIDAYNTHCAVGYLMKASGHKQLAAAISVQHNYDYIKDIHTQGVADWASEHGFSLQELAWIQPTYGGQEEPIRVADPPVGRLHGTVRQKYYHEHKGALGTIAFGNFDTVWNDDGTRQLSNGLAFFSGGKWQCIGNELQGSIQRIHYTGLGAVFAEGSFVHQGSLHSMALLDPQLGWLFPLAANEDAWSQKRFTHTSLGKLHYFSYYRELGKGTYIIAIEGSGKVHLVGFIAGHVNSLSIEANPSSQYASAHNLCISGIFDSLSFAAYRKGNGVDWLKSKNLVVAQLTEPIAVLQKKEPGMYLVDTAFEYEAMCFGNTVRHSIAQSILKDGTIYSIGSCSGTTAPACLIVHRISDPLKPAMSKKVQATAMWPYHVNDKVYFDGKQLRIKD